LTSCFVLIIYKYDYNGNTKRNKSFKVFCYQCLGKDKDGEYNPKFVTETLKAVSEKSLSSFRNKESFLKLLKILDFYF